MNQDRTPKLLEGFAIWLSVALSEAKYDSKRAF
jgi:hypothetical protein